jgi:phosphoribosylaminoimidazole-succinocarboxamide synthase
MEKKELLHKGKAKSVYSTSDPNFLIVEFRDDISAFNAVKLAKLPRKGMVNNYINAFIMEQLKAAGIPVDFERILDDNHALIKRLKMLPLEAIVRNAAAGGLSKRYGIEKGTLLNPPLFEFFLKNDALGDPLITEDHIYTFGWATPEQVKQIREMTLKVNSILKPLFDKAGIMLADFKIEFGLYNGELTLGDEISPDGTRLWDKETGEILDKDRFRQDLGEVVEHYEEVAKRLGVKLPS